MTREEAISVLKVLASFQGVMEYLEQHSVSVQDACNMAIQALSQEPTDTWSIKDVADTFKKHGLIREQEPCDDAISREAVIEWLKAKDIIKLSSQEETARKELKALPPVTPQQKYGEWIKHPEIETSTPEYLMFYECSECGDKQCFYKSDLYKKRFCNSCGAKMQESEEE